MTADRKAVHEAGHLIASLAAGATITRVDLTADDAGVDVTAPAEVHAITAWAGILAERAAGYRRPGYTPADLIADPGHDGTCLRTVAAVVDLHAARRTAHDLVQANLDAVLDLADMLTDYDGCLIDGASVHDWWAQRTGESPSDGGPREVGPSDRRTLT